MGLDQAIDITAEQRKLLLELLERHLPNTTAWVYGSRAKWTSRPQSDLDLVVFATPEQNGRVSDLREAFEESNLPFRVDLFVWDAVPKQFRKHIERDHVVLVEREEMDVAGEWPILSLCEAGVLLFDCEHRTPPAQEFGYPYVGIPQVKDGRIDLASARHITREHFDEWTQKSKPEPFDVVLSRRCNPGESAFVSKGLEFALGQNLVLLRSNGQKVFKPFLRWLVRGPQWREQVGKYINVGAVFDSLKCADIPEFRLSIPPLSKQCFIAHVLGTLDDKIELNRRMNETLEALARALFKSWFVDFDPVRAKMAGRDTGLPKDIANLFPDRFEESELGEIPEGWEVGCLADIAVAPRRGVNPISLYGKTPYIGLEHMPRRSIALTEWGNVGTVASNKSVFEKGEVLFGKLRPYFHKVGIAPVNGVCSTDIVAIASKTKEWAAFVLACVSSVEFVSYTNQASTGTKMPRTNWTTMGDYRMCLPTAPVARSFQNTVQPALERIVANIHESRTIAALCDALLPKLISGELRVKDATLVQSRHDVGKAEVR